MARIAYVNGRYRPIGALAVQVEDRGLQFADGVYEVIKALGGRLCDLERHLDRLERSLAALAIPAPMPRARPSAAILGEVLRRNRLRDAAGLSPGQPRCRAAQPSLPQGRPAVADRHRPPRALPQAAGTRRGRRRCHAARPALEALRHQVGQPAGQRPGAAGGGEAGCREVWLHDADGQVTEGSSSNAYIVDQARPADHAPARASRSWAASPARWCWSSRARDGIEVVERPFTVAEAIEARGGVPDQHLVPGAPPVTDDRRPDGRQRHARLGRDTLARGLPRAPVAAERVTHLVTNVHQWLYSRRCRRKIACCPFAGIGIAHRYELA